MAVNSQRAHPTALVMGNDRQTLAVIRSLARAGFTVVLATTDAASPFSYSRFTAETWYLAPSQCSDAVGRELLGRISDHPEISIIFPVAEREMEVIRQVKLPAGVLVVSVSADVLAKCIDKPALLSQAAELGVPCANWRKVHDAMALDAAIRDIGYPLVIKPCANASDFIGFKAWICHSPIDPLPDLRAFPLEGLIVQKHVQGRRRNIYFVAREGNLLAYGEAEILRTDRLDGTGYAVEGVTAKSTTALVNYTARLVASLSYTGVGCAQFLYDETTGEVCFLEINARLGANAAAICRAGLDLPMYFVDVIRGRQLSIGSFRAGRRYAWLDGDINGIWEERANLTIQKGIHWLALMIIAQVRAKDHVTWECADPLPTLLIQCTRVIKLAKRLFGHR